MTLRDSDDPVVPTKLESQSSEGNPGNAGVGKAVRISRGPDRTPPVLSDGHSVLNRLARILAVPM